MTTKEFKLPEKWSVAESMRYSDRQISLEQINILLSQFK